MSSSYIAISTWSSSLKEQTINYIPGPAQLVTNFPDIGHLAKWSVSSHKFGFGVECLRDEDPETFWQCVAHSFPICQSTFNHVLAPTGPNLTSSRCSLGRRLQYR